MSNYSSLKATIDANVKANNNQEITGAILNSVLNAVVNSMGAKYQYAGVATPDTDPGTPDQNLFYIATTPGTYTNFGGIVVASGECVVLKGTGSTWSKEDTGIDLVSVSQNTSTGHTDITIGSTTTPVASVEEVSQLGQKIQEISDLIPSDAETEDVEIDRGANKYIGFGGNVSNYDGYAISEPISLQRGDKLEAVVAGSGISVLSEYLGDYTNFTPIQLSSQGLSVSYIAEDDIDVVLCGETSSLTTYTITKPGNRKPMASKESVDELSIAVSINSEKIEEIEPLMPTGSETTEHQFSITTGANKYIGIGGSVTSYEGYSISDPITLRAGENLKTSVEADGVSVLAEYLGDYITFTPIQLSTEGLIIDYTATRDISVVVCGVTSSLVSYLITKEGVKVKAAAASVVERLVADTGNYPAYYDNDDYFTKKVEDVRDSMLSSDDSFVFVTDEHMEKNALHSGSLIASLTKHLPLRKVINGGDVGSVTVLSETPNGVDLLKLNMDKFNRTIVGEPVLANVYNVRGNHDFNNRISENAFGGFPSEAVRKYYFGLSKGIFYNEEDGEGCYYYFDNNLSKIRYIVADCNYGSATERHYIGGVQFGWLLNAITTTKSGFGIIFISHFPLEAGVDYSEERTPFSALLTILRAVANKRAGNITYDGELFSYDFTGIDYSLIMALSGHVHCDIEAFADNVLHIATTCDKIDNTYPNPFDENAPVERIDGAITEQAFDVFSISQGMISANRIGAYYNRSFHREIVSLSVGGNADLSADVNLTPVSWRSNNGTGIARTNGAWVYTNDVVSVNSSGVVTALKAGFAFVFAEDSEHNKEFFCVRVN